MTPRKRTVAEKARNPRQNFINFRHATRAILAAGHLTVIGANDLHPIPLQPLQIALRGGVMPHAHIHRGGNHHRCTCRQKQSRGQIIRHALRHFSHNLCRGGCHQNKVCGARQFYMAHLGLFGQVKQLCEDFRARKGRY